MQSYYEIFSWQYKPYVDIRNNILLYEKLYEHTEPYCVHILTNESILRFINPYMDIWNHTAQNEPYFNIRSSFAYYKSTCQCIEQSISHYETIC